MIPAAMVVSVWLLRMGISTASTGMDGVMAFRARGTVW